MVQVSNSDKIDTWLQKCHSDIYVTKHSGRGSQRTWVYQVSTIYQNSLYQKVLYHMILKIFAAYTLIGTVLAEVIVRVDRKRQVRPSMRQYLNLVLIWPIVVYIAHKRWKK